MKQEAGQSLVELLLAMVIFVLSVSAITFMILDVYLADRAGRERMISTFLAQEGIEAARAIRDNSWTNLTSGEHGLALSGNNWIFQGTQEDVSSQLRDGARKIIVEDLDSDRKKITSQVVWKLTEARSQSVNLITYLTNWLKAGIGDWSLPSRIAGLNFSGNQDGLKIQVQDDYAYLVRNDGTPDFVIIDISDPAAPVLAGSLNLSGIPQNIAVSNNYAYVSNGSDSQELQIIDISAPSAPNVVGIFNAPGTADGRGVFVVGEVVYLTRNSSANDELLLINAANPSSPSFLGSLNLNATAYELLVMGNYAYIASASDNQELQVVDISASSSPFLVGSLNLSGSANALTITGFLNTVVIGQGSTLNIIDVALASSPSLSGSLNLAGTVNDISLANSNTYAFLATSNANREFQVVNIANLSAPSLLGFANISGSSALFGIAYQESQDRAYAVANLNTEEFIVFGPR